MALLAKGRAFYKICCGCIVALLFASLAIKAQHHKRPSYLLGQLHHDVDLFQKSGTISSQSQVFTLQPGHTLVVPRPASSQMTIKTERPDKLDFSTSANGIMWQAVQHKIPLGKHKVSLPGILDQPSLVKIKASARSSKPIKFAMAVTRSENPGDMAKHYQTVSPIRDSETSNRSLGKLQANQGLTYQKLEPGKHASYQVQGPQWIMISGLAKAPKQSVAKSQHYHLNALLDGKPFESTTFEAPSYKLRPYQNFMANYPMLELPAKTVFIPEGKHRLTLRTMSTLYLHVNNSIPNFLLSTNESWLYGELGVGQKHGNILQELTNNQQKAADSVKRSLKHQTYSRGASFADYQVHNLRQNHPFDVKAKELREIVNAHQYYQSLLPQNLAGTKPVQYYKTLDQSYYGPYTPKYTALASESNIINRALTKSKEAFVKPGTSSLGALRYQLPDSPYGHHLRLRLKGADKLDKSYTLHIKIDGQKEHTMTIDPAKNKGLNAQWTFQQAAMQLLKRRHQIALSNDRFNLPLTIPPQSVESHELWLDENAGKLKVWVTPDCNANPLRISIQQSVKQPRGMSQREYLDALDHFGDAKINHLFTHYLLSSEQEPTVEHNLQSIDDVASFALKHDWWLLKRDLEQSRKTFQTFQSDHNQKPPNVTDLKAKDPDYDHLSYWYRKLLVNDSDSKTKKQALDNIYQYLIEHDEISTLTTILRYEYGHTEDMSVKNKVYRLLMQVYDKQGDSRLTEKRQLASVQALNTPTPGVLNRLALLMYEKGDFQNAIRIQLALKERDRNKPVLLASALQKRLWRVYDNELSKLGSDKKRAQWRAYKDFMTGHYQRGLDRLQKAGTDGQMIIRHIERLKQAFNHLARQESTNTAKRLAKAKEQLMQSIGYSHEQSALDLIEYGGGFKQLYSSNNVVNQYMVASQNRPVIIKAYGPQRLTIKARQIFNDRPDKVSYQWLSLDHNGQYEHHLTTSNHISPSYGYQKHLNQWAGEQTEIDKKLQPGENKLVVRPRHGTILIKVDQRQSLLPTPTVKSLIEQPLSMDHNARPDGAGRRRFLIMDRSGHMKYFKPASLAKDRTESDPDEESSQRLSKPAAQKLTELERMQYLAHQGTQSDKLDPEALAKATKIYHQNRYQQKLHQTWRYLQNYTKWRQLTQVASPAGETRIRVRDYHPQSVSTDVLDSLLDVHLPKNNHFHVLSSQTMLNIGLRTRRTNSVRVTFHVVEPYRLKSAPAYVNYRIDGDTRQITLTPDDPDETVEIPLDAGVQDLKAWLDNPVNGQYVWARVHQKGAKAPIDLVPEKLQSFYITTQDKPVKVYPQGPTLVRIARYDHQYNLAGVDYRYVAEGDKEFTIDPDNSKEQYIRLAELIPNQETRARLRKIKQLEKDGPADTAAQYVKPFKPFNNPEAVAQSGTWLFEGGYRTRFAINDRTNEVEKFSYLKAAYYKYLASHNIFLNASTEARYHVVGDPAFKLTLGATGQWMPLPQMPPLIWYGNIDAVTQKLNRDSYDERQAFAGHTQLGLAQDQLIGQSVRNRPSVSFSGHAQGLSNVPNQVLDALDQNVFTNYFENHRYSFRLQDRLVYRPYSDTRFELMGNTNTNESMSLDAVRSEVKWSQIVHSFTSELRYQFRHYMDDDDRQGTFTDQRLFWKLSYRNHLWNNILVHGFCDLGFELKQNDQGVSCGLSLSPDNPVLPYYDRKRNELPFRSLRRLQGLDRRWQGAVHGNQ